MSVRIGVSPFVKGIIVCLIGAVCFSTKAILVKLAYRETNIDAVSLLALRMIFSLPFFIIAAIVSSRRENNIRFTPRQWMSVAAIGAMGYYVSSLLDFVGLQYVSAGMERLVLFIYPTIVLMIAAVVLKQQVKRIQWIAVLITYAGLFIAFQGEASLAGADSTDVYYGSFLIFLCAITYAIYIVGSGRLIPVIGAAKFNSYAMSFACVAVLLHFFITSDTSLLQFEAEVYWFSLLMAVLSTVIPSYLVSEGIKRIGSDNAAIVGSVGPVSTIIQASIFLSEPILAVQIAGTVLILVGVLLIGRVKPSK